MQIKPLQENVLSNEEHRSLVRMEEVAAVVVGISITIAVLGAIIGLIALSQASNAVGLPLGMVGVSMFMIGLGGVMSAEDANNRIEETLEENPQKIVPDVFEMGEKVS